MKYKYLMSLVAVLLLWATSAHGQNNTITIPDVSVAKGRTISLPINMDNTADVVAVQFTLSIPQGLTIDASSATLSDRSDDHTVTFRSIGTNKYMAMIFSAKNKAIKGRTGRLLSISLTASNSVEENLDYPLVLSDVVMGARDGSDLTTGYKAGKVNVATAPDLEVSNVAVSESEVNPGGMLNVSWTVTNVDGYATKGGWNEQILLKDDKGATKLIGTLYYNEPINASGEVIRTAELNIPAVLGMDGDCHVVVKLTPNSDAGEPSWLQSNNSCVVDVQVEKRLTLQLPKNVIEEGTAGVRATLTRTGNCGAEETFAIQNTADGLLNIPVSVIIPKGQSSASFTISVPDDNEVSLINEAEVSVVGAYGYEGVSAKVEIIENDKFHILVALDKAEYNEGETIHATVSLPKRIDGGKRVLYCTIEQPKRFALPNIVEVPKDDNTITIDIPVLNDNIPANPLSVELTVSAENYEPGTALLMLNDDDVPAIDLTVTPDIISEGAGANALYATIRRSDVTNNQITINLKDDSNGLLFYDTQVTLEEGVTEKTIPIGVSDNDIAENDRIVNLMAEVYISSCSCGATGGKQSSVSKKITILDNDGATISIHTDRTMIMEGDENGATVTVRRNTADTSEDVTVTLSATDNGFSIPNSVIIPAGQSSATFKVVVPQNSEQQGNRIITITATSEGFCTGTVWMQITDQTFADMQIDNIEVGGNIIAGEDYTATVTVSNKGVVQIPEFSTVTLNAPDNDITLTIPEAIPVGETKQIKAVFVAPEIPGSYQLIVECNKNRAFNEPQMQNNKQSISLKVMPAYKFSVTTDKDVYNIGESVILSGSVNSLNGKFSKLEVEPYIIYHGAKSVLNKVSCVDGTFCVKYQLPEGLAGDFGVGVCVPDDNTREVMHTFSVYGMSRASATYIKNYLYVGEDFHTTVDIQNLSCLPIHNVKATMKDESGNYTFEMGILDVLEGNATVEVPVKLRTEKLTDTGNWERMYVTLSSDEGVSYTFVMYNFASSRMGLLSLSTSRLNTTLTKGKEREIPIIVTNRGIGKTGKITVDIPKGQQFVSLVTTPEILSLEKGDSATVVLRFNPDNLDVNVKQNGVLAFSCENADGQTLTYSMKVVSEEKGNLNIPVQDENTIYGNANGEHPYVSGATVEVKDYSTGVTLYSATTGEDGVARFTDIDEGFYTVYVTAPKHDSYTQNVLVSPAETTEHIAYISYQAVSIKWTVEETGIEDKYEISATVDYETQVPVPVVKLDCPDELDLNSVLDGGSLLYNVVLTNVGLITAQNVTVSLPQAEGFKFTPLTEFAGFDLPAQQSRIVPVRVTLVEESTPAKPAKVVSDSKGKKKPACNGDTYLGWEWPCGKDSKYAWLDKVVKFGLRTCEPNTSDDSSELKKKTGKEKIIEPTPPVADTTEVREPVLRYPTRPVSQVDLVAINNLVTKIACAMVCLAPDPIGDKLGKIGKCLPFDLDEMKFTVPDLSCIPDFAKDQLPFDPDDLELMIQLGKGGMSKEALDDILTGKVKDLVNEGLDKFKEKCPLPLDADDAEIFWNAATGNISKDEFIKAGKEQLKKKIKDAAGKLYDKAKDKIPEPFKDIPCVLEEFFKEPIENAFDHALDKALGINADSKKSKATSKAVITPKQSYVGKVWLYMDFVDIRSRFYKEMVDAPELQEDLDTYRYVICSLVDINCEMEKLHRNEHLYDTDMSVLYDMAIKKMPQKVATWYDFDLEKYLERQLNTYRINDGLSVEGDNHMKKDILDEIDADLARCHDELHSYGCVDLTDLFLSIHDDAVLVNNASSNNTCATVSLKFSQEMAFTRQAFRGTLEIDNSGDVDLTNISANITATDEKGKVATAHEMQIEVERIDGFGQTEEGMTLESGKTGVITYLFIPTKYAAQEVPVRYDFGGTLYFDNGDDLQVRSLYPVTLTVKPSPNLDLTYFMQRDIKGDDPLTEEIEPSEEAEFSLLINNIGYGDATDVRMITEQPKIIDNEKGLLVDFELMSSQLNGGDKTLALGGSVATDFGTIPARSTAYAQWWLKSSLLGHFTSYDVEATHVTSYGNPDLSLLNDVTIHELIRSIDVEADRTKLVGFVTNDIADADDTPDMIYLSDGEIETVSTVKNVVVQKVSDTEYALKVDAANAGWCYGSVVDPTYGMSALKSVVRQSDGREMPLRNFWLTDCTLRDGKDPLYENRIHFVDEMNTADDETYILTFEPTPELLLDIAAIDNVPEEGSLLIEPLNSVKVVFNKRIDPTTFTADDISLAVQGNKQDVSSVIISTEDDKTFTVDFSALNENVGNGYFVFTVNTSDIVDTEGFHGKNGHQAGWIMYRDGLVSLITSTYPQAAGTVLKVSDSSESSGAKALRGMPSDDSAEYGSMVRLTTIPNDGYEFKSWTVNGEVFSTDPILEYVAISDMDVKANYSLKSLPVTISDVDAGGSVIGSASGIYSYGDELTVMAVPDEDYVFAGWTVNGKNCGTDLQLEVTVDEAKEIKAEFKRDIFQQSLVMSRGWNWVSSFVSEPIAVGNILGNVGNVSHIVSQFDEIILDPEYGMIGGIEELLPGVAYKINASYSALKSFKGHLHNLATSPIEIHSGWNWISYPHTVEMNINDVLPVVSEGDYITSQLGFSEYADGHWEGTLNVLTPGVGYIYKSSTDKTLMYDFSEKSSRAKVTYPNYYSTSYLSDIDIHKYPSTMNVIARISADSYGIDEAECRIFAFAGNECRGESQYVNGNHYLTIYGDEATIITFVVENQNNGSAYMVKENVTFGQQVLGSRKSPFTVTVTGTTGVDNVNDASRKMRIYSIEGVLINSEATTESLRRLSPGVYIVDGQKFMVK